MDFSLSEEHLMAQQMVRDFAQKRSRPRLASGIAARKSTQSFCRAWQNWGILGINIPVRYGGQGFD